MAAACNNPLEDLQDELTCSICLDHFKDPVSIECGHSFCRACISQSWRGIRSNFTCPQCRHISKWKFLRPNRPLENMVEISKRLLSTKTEDFKNQCKKHQEPLKLYCQVDAREICVICRESVDHRSHTVVPLEETTKEFKVDLQERLKSLRKEVADIIKRKAEEEEKAQKHQDEVVQKQSMLVAEFEALRHLLADREKHFAHRLEYIQKTIMEKKNAIMIRLNAQLACIQKNISDLEKNARASASPNFQELKASSTRHAFEVVQKESRPCNWHTGNSSPAQDFKSITVPVCFDLKTANPNLVVACNRKCVKYIEEPINRYPCPERFDMKPCVLATIGFRSGRHYWEVGVGGGIYWTTGVARQSVRRKGGFKIEPNIGIWAIGLLGMYTDRYYAFTNPDTLLNPRVHPERIGVYLNCDESFVSFYNAVNYEHLFTFKSLQVHETIFPFFCVGALGTELWLDDELFEMF